jgi:toxin ParE1/3/4
MASAIAAAIEVRLELLREFPFVGRPYPGRPEYRQMVVAVLKARYVVEYRVTNETVFILRVFHGRENREP